MEEHYIGVISDRYQYIIAITHAMLHQWWDRMYQHIINCPQCAIATDVRRRQSPSLKSTPVDHPLQIVGIDIIKLPLTTNENRYTTVFHDLFTKWAMVYTQTASDQKAMRLAKLLVKEIVPGATVVSNADVANY